MTVRVLYRPAWEHGFETRDKRDVSLVGKIGVDRIVWAADRDLIQTSVDGLDLSFVGGPHSPNDIFCKPAPGAAPLECWVNVYPTGRVVLYSPDQSRRSADAACQPVRIGVHMREVTSELAAKEPGSLSAADVEKLATRWSGWWQHDGCSASWREAADALRRAARGEW